MDLKGNILGLEISPPNFLALTFDIWGLQKLLKIYKNSYIKNNNRHIFKTLFQYLKRQNDFLHIDVSIKSLLISCLLLVSKRTC